MDRNLIKLCVLFMGQSVILRLVESSPSNDDNRHPRVSGRIIKLYSGYKTEPVICTEEGFQADPVDCSTFYRCMKTKSGKFSVLRFQCGPGTVYDPDTEICNHPHSTKRTDCGSSRQYQILPAPVSRDNENDIESSAKELPSPMNTWRPLNLNQTSAWYRPNIGTSTPQYQSVTSLGYGTFTPADEIHMPIEVNKPGDLSTSNTSVVSTAYPWSTTTSSTNHPKETITQPSGQSHKKVDENTNECYNDGFMGDNKDCRKFYRCVNNQRGGFTKYEFMCSESTIWDDEKQSCNHPWAVRRSRCKQDAWSESLPPIDNDYYFDKTDISSEDLISRTTKTLVSSTQDYGNRINNDKANVEPNPNNLNTPSNSYLTENEQVTPTIQHKQTQPTSHYLHPLIQTQKELQESITKASTYGFSTDDPSYSTRNPSNKAIDIKCTESGFMGDPNDCKKFYRCVQNGKNSYIKYEFLCGEGTAWDERAESCNHAWMVKECGGKSLHAMTTTRKSYIDEKHTTAESNGISEGNGYNVGGIQSREPNALLVTTSLPLNVPNKDESTEICNSPGHKGSTTDCRKFYSCIENDYGGFTKLEYICDEGTVWDSNIEACNHAREVKNCKVNANNASRVSTPSTESTIITTVSFIQSTIQSSNYNDEVQSASYYKESTPNIVPTKTDNQCYGNGFMADRNDCRKFFRCVENGNNGFIRYEYSCGDGTAWDAKINACNHLRAVPTCGKDYYSESTPIKQPPPESDENVNSYITQTNEINVSTLRTESTTAINLATKLTTANNKLNVCSRSGFIGDSSNCQKFYRCVSNGDGSYMMHEFSCGEGTVWDPEIEACNHAAAVKRCGGTLETQNDILTTPPQPPTTMTSVNDEFDNGYAQSFDEKESTVNHNLQSSSENPPIFDKTQECNKVGFMADRSNCKKFYRCVENGQGGFNSYEFSCGDGTAWDQNKEACDHISSVKECGSMINDISSSTVTSSQSGPPVHSTMISYPQYDDVPTTVQSTKQNDDCVAEGFYGNPSDCQKFYRCVSNQQEGFIKYEFSCGEGTIWDQNIQACNHKYSDNMNCTISPTTVSKPKPSETTKEPANSEETQNNASSNEFSTTEKGMNLPPNRNNTCSLEGFHPNLEDCKRFIRCVDNGDGGYVRYDFTCGEGTIWVQDIQACDHDNDNSTCSNGISTSTEAHPLTTQDKQTVTSSTVQSMITNTITDPTENSVAIISNTDKCNEEGYFGDSNNCQRFYRCVADDNGSFIKYDYICGEGTAWDLDRQSCNHINSVKRCTSTQDSQTTTLETHVVPQTTENIKTTISPTTSVVQPQATENIKPTNIAHPQTTEQIKTTTPSTTGITQPQTTENIKTTTQSTSTPIVTSMQEDSSTSDDCNDEGYFGNKENCQKFYRCVNNGKGSYTKYDYICGEGTMWDQDILACNHPQDVRNPSCKEDSKTSPSSVSTGSSIQTTESTSSSSQSTPTSMTSKQTTASPSESSSQGTSNCSGSENVKNQNITCTKAGYFPNPNDCKKFYRCVDWDSNGERFSIFHFECGEGTIWDPALDTCNYEDSVYPPRNCKNSQAQNDSTTTTSTVTSEENTTSSMSTETTTQTSQTTQQTGSTDSTTQQMTSTESTTQQSTSTESTTQQITSTDSTTQQFSSTESTTQQITTTVSSTPQSTSTETTTQQITSTESTTQQISSTESTTQQFSSTESTTQQITSTQSTTQQQLSTDATTTQSTTTTEQFTTQQTTPTTETITTEKTTTSESTSTTTEQPTSEKSTTESSTTTEQLTSTTGEQSSTEQSTTETSQQSSTGLSTTEETTTTTVQQSTELSTESQSSSSSTENGMHTTTESIQETTSTESSSTNKCPDTESDQYLYACPTSFKRHPKYCNLFYQCLEDNDSHELKIAVFNCPNGTIYDESKIQCVEERNAQKKCDGDIAQKRRFKRLNVDSKEIITASRNTYRCPRVGHFPFEKNEECSPALLRCTISKSGKLRGFVYRCPENYVYWSISRKCEPISKMAHCKNSTSQWANRFEIPIERKNIAY